MLRPLTERSHSSTRPLLWSAFVLLLGVLPLSACSSPDQTDAGDGTSQQMDQDSGSADTGPVMPPPPSCVTDPQNYLQFLNACTDAGTVAVSQSRLPHQLIDGGLPPPQTWNHDGGLPPDMCLGADAGPSDAGSADAGTKDAGSADAGNTDAGTVDAGP